MATLISIQPTPDPHFEPDEGWKNNLRQHIEITHKPAAENLKRESIEKIRGLSPAEASRVQADYDDGMVALRRTANDQYCQLLERARQELRWAAGEKTNEKWSETLMKEERTLLDIYKKDAIAKTFVAGDRSRRPSNVPTEPIPERSPPALSPLGDRKSRPYFSTSPSASRRTTLADTANTRPTTSNPNLEPDEEWKTNLRQRIEVTLKPTAERLKRESIEKIKGLSPAEASKVQADYEDDMAVLRRTTQQRYDQLLERERRERRWNAGDKVDEKWTEILAKEEQALLGAYKTGTTANTHQPGATRRSDGHGWSSDFGFPSRHTPETWKSTAHENMGELERKKDELEKREAELHRREVESKRREVELQRRGAELKRQEAELEGREAEVTAKEECLRQEEANRLAREEEERRRVRKALRDVRNRGGVLA